MNLEAMIVRGERGLMRRFPAGMVVAANARLHQWRGEQELRILPDLVVPGTIAVDVGAHFGTYSLALARLVGPAGQVVSIEPIAEDARMLQRAAHQLRLPMVVHQCALSSQRGTAHIHVPNRHGNQKTALASLESHHAEDSTSREVQVRTLDDILASARLPISFVKIDVEGHELSVLAGSKQTLQIHRPTLLIEIEQRFNPIPLEEVFDTIIAMGYGGGFMDRDGAFRSLDQFDAATHQSQEFDVLSSDYVGNFIFRPI